MGHTVQKLPPTYTEGTWVPTWAGFSADPAGTARYILIGKLCFAWFNVSSAGTSNATTAGGKTMTLPFTSYNGTSQVVIISRIVNAGANQSAPGMGVISSNSNVMTVYRDSTTATAWTASGNCYWAFAFCYEIA